MINEHLWNRIRELRERFGPGAWYAAMAFLVIGFFQIFNPLSPGLVLGLLGFKVLFLYWPLALLAYVYFDRVEKLAAFMKLIAYASIPVNLFGLTQFTRGPELLIDIYGPQAHVALDMAYLGDVQQVKSFLRVIGTFASSGQYGSFLVANSIFCFTLLFFKLKPWERLVFIGIQALNFTALLASGSRSSLVALLLCIALFFIFCRQVRAMLVPAIIVGLCLYGGFKFLGRSVQARFETLGEYKHVKHGTFETTTKMFFLYLEKYPFGKGLGSASTAAKHLGKGEALTFELIENYPTKLQTETGLPGVILFYLFVILLMVRGWDVWLRQTPGEHYLIVTAIFCYCLSQFLVRGIFFILDAPPIPIFLWTMVGAAARLSISSVYESSHPSNAA